MLHNTRIRLIALVGLLASWIGAGSMMPAINASASEAQLKYTDEASEGAPAPVVVAQSIGILRGIIVNYLWIRADKLKEDGKFFEAYQIGRWVTTLQPRVAKVWSFQAWNMAYNISVATHTKEERWSWVQKGIRLIREHGIRYNPNDMMLYKELSWHFFHKVQGFTDDAHHYYKQQIAARWHGLLGEPPFDHDDRIEWIREVAEAPARTDDLLAARPDVAALVTALAEAGFELDEPMLRTVSILESMETSYLARELRMDEAVREVQELTQLREEIRPFFDPILRLRPVRNNPEFTEAWPALLAHVRKRVLKDEYNMDAAHMLFCVENRGPLDWRSPAAHSLYWAEIGVEKGLTRHEQAEFDQVNTDRIILHSLQNLKRMGMVVYDPIAGEVGWGPDLRFIQAYENAYRDLRARVPYWGRATDWSYRDGYRNFLIESIFDYYNWGEFEKANAYYSKLRTSKDPVFVEEGKEERFTLPIKEFLLRETADRWSSPHIARSGVLTLLVTGFRAGLARQNEEIWENNYENARFIHAYFQAQHGDVMTIITPEDRMPMPEFSELMDQAFIQAMLDEGSLVEERAMLWSTTLPLVHNLKLRNYDRIVGPLQASFARRGLPMPFDQVFPAPVGIEEYRRAQGLTNPDNSGKEDIDIERK